MTPVAIGVWAQRTFVTDRRTDRQTDGFAIAIDEHCIAAMFVKKLNKFRFLVSGKQIKM